MELEGDNECWGSWSIWQKKKKKSNYCLGRNEKDKHKNSHATQQVKLPSFEPGASRKHTIAIQFPEVPEPFLLIASTDQLWIPGNLLYEGAVGHFPRR